LAFFKEDITMIHHQSSNRRQAAWIAAISLLLILSACSPSSGGTQNGPTKSTPTTGPVRSTPNPQGNVTYHGGPVQLTPSAYLIFWGKEWQDSSDLKDTITTIKSYYAHVGDTAYQQVLTQYYQINPDGSKSYI
jgi:hypothetical protein